MTIAQCKKTPGERDCLVMSFRLLVIAAVLNGVCLHADDRTPQQPLDRQSRFNSVEEFIATVKAFEPAQTNDWLAYQFGAVELGQPEDENTGRVTRASSVTSCTQIWGNGDSSLIFAIANPPIAATRCSVGVIFLLNRTDKRWRITDCKKFTAYGKDSSVEVKLTSENTEPVITATKYEGGQHLSSSISASYRISDFSLALVGLE